MKRLRIRVVLLACWLIIFYLMTNYWESLNVSPITHLFMLVLVIAVLASPEVKPAYRWWVLVGSTAAFVLIKALLVPPLLGTYLPITAIETSTVILTTLLLLWVRSAIHEFERAVAHVTLDQQKKISETAVEGQSVLYREVRRARNHQRPLSILAISIDDKSIQGAVERMVKEAQLNVIRQFTLASVSKSLCEKLEDCDTVVQSNDHFLVLLPETKPDDLPALVERLRKQVIDEVGVTLNVGSASLPQDGFTLEGLLDKANLEMQEIAESKVLIETEQLFIKHKTV